MQDDVPAAIPLIAFISGLLFAGSCIDAIGLGFVAILVLALRRPRAAIAIAALAAGVAVAAQSRASAERRDHFVASFPVDRFVVVEAPLDRDWMTRDVVSALRLSRFCIGGVAVDEPVTLVARFRPKQIELERTVVAEGFLRRNEREELTLIVKSPLLMHYEGQASPWLPSTWNRMLARRLRPFATRYPTEVALTEALALGRGERLANEVRDSYKRAGTYHLLVFSGLQIALAAAALAALLRWLHAPRASDWSLLIFSAAAPLFIGATASVSRAAIGIGLYAVSRLLHRPTTLENLWCIAALVHLFTAPADAADAAFQLTYAGAGALLFVAKPLRTRSLRWIAYAVAIECVITPITLFHFHQYALGGSLTTVVLTPVITLMLALATVACAYPTAAVFVLIGLLHTLSLRINDLAAVATGAFAAPPATAFAIALMCALAAIALLRGRARSAGIVASFSLAIFAAFLVARRDVSESTITVLDVGQGDAILLRSPGYVVLIDGGPSPARLIPLLAERGVRSIDAVILTHAHPDHCGGLPAALTRFSVRHLWISPRRFTGDCAQELLATAASHYVPVHLVRDGDAIRFADVSLHALVPDRTFRRSPENNSSIVLDVAIGKRKALLTGDIEREAESLVASRVGCVDLLKVAHHGSHTSSTPPLLDAIAPRVAVISCGRHNLFGHPHSDVLRALHDAGAAVCRTDRNGTVDIAFRGDHIFVHREIDTP